MVPSSTSRRVPTLALLLALGAPLAGLGSAVLADPVSDPEIGGRRQQVFEDESLQIDLPGYEGFCRAERSVNDRPTEWRPRQREPRFERSLRAPAAMGAVAQIFQWALLALAAVALVIGLVWLLQQLFQGSARARKPKVDASGEKASETGTAASEAPVVEDLDLLLHRGEYGAAIHLLLLRAVRLLGRRGGRRISAGHTSREVLAGASLQPSARSAFGELVAAVERFLFGGRELDADDFDRCREAFGVVEQSLRKPSPEEAP